MRLNLGCGDRYVEGWTNVDLGTPHRVDEKVDLTAPLPAHWYGAATHIYAGHLLEHLSQSQSAALLHRLLDCAAPDGCVLMIVGPDVPVAEQMAAAGTLDTTYHSLDSIKNGAGRWAGDVHLWECSEQTVADLARTVGWPVVQSLGGMRGLRGLAEKWPVADPNPDWQFAVRCYTGRTSR